MADVAMGDLRFDLTADNSQFMAAVKQAKEAQTQAASEMGSKFEAASEQAETAFTKMTEKMREKSAQAMQGVIALTKALAEGVANGAEGAEQATTNLFKKTVSGGFDKVWDGLKAAASAAPGWGKVAAGLLAGIESLGLKDMLKDKILPSIAGGLDSIFEKFNSANWGSALASLFPQSMADGVQQRVDDMVEGVRTSLQKLAGTWQGVSEEVKKAVDSMNDRTKNVETQTGFIGLDTGAKAAATAREMMLRTIGKAYKDLNEAEKEELATAEKRAAIAAIDAKARQAGDDWLKKYEQTLDAVRKKNGESTLSNNLLGAGTGEKAEAMELARIIDALGGSWEKLSEKQKLAAVEQAKLAGLRAQDAEDYRKAEQEARSYADSVDAVVAALKRQGDMALANAGRSNGAKSAFERAIEQGNAMAGSYGRGKVSGLQDDPSVIAARNEMARKAQEAANTNYRAEQSRTLQEANDRGFLDQSALGATPGAVEKLRVEMDLMNKARREGVTLDASQLSLNAAIADSMGKIAQATAEARERYEALREVGRTVTGALEDAFSKMIQGAGFQWKEFITGLQQDLAKLAFKKGIESLLLGTATGGGGLFAGLAGLLSGARADGGPVGAGKAYLVGERGPELFVPQSAGGIVSNQAMSGAGATNINMRIDLAGANGDETIARISAAAARQAAMAAIAQTNDGFAMRQRRLQLLGT